MLKIEQMYAFVAKEEEGEGLMAFKIGDQWMPMVGADMERIKQLLPIAKKIQKVSGKRFKILKFTNREEINISDVEK